MAENEFTMFIPAPKEPCKTCHGTRWVCCDHPDRPGPCGETSDGHPTCDCPARECVACPTCNHPIAYGARNAAPALPRGMAFDETEEARRA